MELKTKIEAEIARLQAKLDKLKAALELVEDDDLGDLFSGCETSGKSTLKPIVIRRTPASGISKSRKRQRKGAVSSKIQGFFKENGNKWATLKEIMEALELKRDSVRQVLYKTKPELFDRDSQLGGGRESRFRLKK